MWFGKDYNQELQNQNQKYFRIVPWQSFFPSSALEIPSELSLRRSFLSGCLTTETHKDLNKLFIKTVYDTDCHGTGNTPKRWKEHFRMSFSDN